MNDSTKRRQPRPLVAAAIAGFLTLALVTVAAAFAKERADTNAVPSATCRTTLAAIDVPTGYTLYTVAMGRSIRRPALGPKDEFGVSEFPIPAEDVLLGDPQKIRGGSRGTSTHGRYGDIHDWLGVTVATGIHFSPPLDKPRVFDECGQSLDLHHVITGTISEGPSFGVRADVDVGAFVGDAERIGALTIVLHAGEPPP